LPAAGAPLIDLDFDNVEVAGGSAERADVPTEDLVGGGLRAGGLRGDDAVGEVAALALPVGPGDRADTVDSLLDGRTEVQVGVFVAGERGEDVGPLGFGTFEDVRIGGVAVNDRTQTIVGEAFTPVGVPFDTSDLVVVAAEDLSSAATDTAPACQDDVLVHSRAWLRI
jgi:hypothetical protein